MGAEMDCCDSTDDGRRFYVELKTSREVGMPAVLLSFFFISIYSLATYCPPLIFLYYAQLDYHTEERFEREKLLKIWVMFCFLPSKIHYESVFVCGGWFYSSFL